MAVEANLQNVRCHRHDECAHADPDDDGAYEERRKAVRPEPQQKKGREIKRLQKTERRLLVVLHADEQMNRNGDRQDSGVLARRIEPLQPLEYHHCREDENHRLQEPEVNVRKHVDAPHLMQGHAPRRIPHQHRRQKIERRDAHQREPQAHEFLPRERVQLTRRDGSIRVHESRQEGEQRHAHVHEEVREQPVVRMVVDVEP